MASTAWPSTTSGGGAPRRPRPGRAYLAGRVDYLHAARLQHALVAERIAGRVADTLLLLEHPPVVTLGRGARAEHLLARREVLAAAGAEVWETSRGGDVTYHGPGQLVGYAIFDLRDHGRDVALYLRRLEEALLGVLGDWGLAGGRRPGLTGVWAGKRKVAAIGVRAERWVTAHGFALNVAPDLGHFGWIVPCGITDGSVTSMAELLAERGAPAPDLDAVAESARRHMGRVFDLELAPADAAELSRLALPEGAPLGGVTRLFPATAGDGGQSGTEAA